MFSSKLHSNKELHFWYNSTKLKKGIFCKKCKNQSNRRIKKYDNIQSLYQHLMCAHSCLDEFEEPTRTECIIDLQILSDEIQEGMKN